MRASTKIILALATITLPLGFIVMHPYTENFTTEKIQTPGEEEPSIPTPPEEQEATNQYESEYLICTDDCPLIEPETAPGTTPDTAELKETLRAIAREKGLSEAKIEEIELTIGGAPGTGCPNGESTWRPHAIGDDGNSLGLVQINLPAHPEISPSEALDPIFAMNFIVEEFIAGNEWKWTCWNKIFALK